MSLTEEQAAWIDQVRKDLAEESNFAFLGGWTQGATEALEKFPQGIQWNKHPDILPEPGQYVDIITDKRRRITDCELEVEGFYHREGDRVYAHAHVTHWAYIKHPEA